jgi:2-C-methyl-D-erythritol 4-phosphate cytidylyltransferase
MKSDLPKQFLLLLDAPILMHTLERFALAIEDIELIVVLPEQEQTTWKNLCGQMGFDLPHQVVTGGATRYDSVKNGLAACTEDGLVGIHDGVRPLVSEELIVKCFAAAETHGSALPVVPVTQSLRKVDGEQSAAMSREGVVEVQTPQCFRLETLKPCYSGPVQDHFTDDATVFEAHGHQVHLMEGEPTNLKITTQADLKIAEAILGMART